ncbi:hypothetical protein Tco_0633457 [Tanacetum coccineum]
MTTLAEFMIIVGVENRPPLLEKSLYDSWKSRMELYIENQENGRMILNSLQNGLLVWPTVVEEDGTTRTKKSYFFVFNQGDDPIAYLNKAMAFLTAVAYLRFPSTNNQLRTSLNPRNQATIQDERVTVQQVQGGARGKKGHMARQCTQSKRPRNVPWFKEKAMLAEAQESGQILDEEQLAFLADPGIPDSQVAQKMIPNTSAFQTEYLDAYDSDCDDVSNAETLKDIFNVFDKDLLNEIMEVQTVFNQMEADVQQCYDMCDEFHCCFDDVNVEIQSCESCVKCVGLDVEILNKQSAYNDLSKSYSQLKKHCISLELTMQLNQEIFQKDLLSNNQKALEISKYFENNDLKAQLQAKDTKICKLKEHIKTMRENDKEEKVKHEMDEIETTNIELEHIVAKLLYENEHLHKEIKHLKKIYKDQFNSIKKTRALFKEHDDSLIAQLNYKSMENADLKRKEVENATQIPIVTTVARGMFKLDLDPLAPRTINTPSILPWRGEAHIGKVWLRIIRDTMGIEWSDEMDTDALSAYEIDTRET